MLYTMATVFALPFDPLHRVIVMGFGAYLVLYAVVLAALPAAEPYATTANVVQVLAFLGLLGVWALAAWRNEKPPQASPAVVRRLWSWR